MPHTLNLQIQDITTKLSVIKVFLTNKKDLD